MKKNLGNNAKTSREKNIALIVQLISRFGVISRADLAKHTGLTQASITYITKELIDWGLIYETGTIERKTRHPSIGLSINREKYTVLSIQINRSYARTGLYTLDGAQLQMTTQTFVEPHSPREVLDRIYGDVDTILAAVSDRMVVLGIGVALPGPFLPSEGKIRLMSGSPGWENIDLFKELTDRYGLPVVLEHDANCGALAELWNGTADEMDNILYVMAADGIGAGIICNGKLYRGQLGTAGEIGHMSLNFAGPRCECGSRGCLELYCSMKKLKRDYLDLLFEAGEEVSEDLTADQILHLASQRDPMAYRALEKSVSYLGMGLANLVNILNPGTIILADRFSAAGEVLVELTAKHMKKHLLAPLADHIEIRLTSEPCETIILRGASIAILYRLLKKPAQFFECKQGS